MSLLAALAIALSTWGYHGPSLPLALEWGPMPSPTWRAFVEEQSGNWRIVVSWGVKADVEDGDSEKLIRVMTHELGHVFGLPHSADRLSIMHDESEAGQLITTADRLAAQLYWFPHRAMIPALAR